MAKQLTIKSIDAAKPKQTEYKITVDRGLYIRIAPSGIKTWLVRYVVDGRQIQYRLPKPYGVIGDGYMSLAEAKALNGTIQSLAREGKDFQVLQNDKIQQEKDTKLAIENSKKAEIANNLNFLELFNVWIVDGVNRVDNNENIRIKMNKHAMPSLGNIPLRELSESHLLDIYRTLVKQKKCRTAVLLSKDIKQMLRWAEKRQPYRLLMINGNPAELVNINNLLPADYQETRERVLNQEDIRKLNSIFQEMENAYENASNKYTTNRPLIKETQLAIWLCLSSICRIGELLMTEWSHVDFEKRTWFIPKANVKGTKRNKHDQLVSLSDFSFEHFKKLHQITGLSKWAFPSTSNENHVCIKTVSKQVGDRQTQFKQRTKDLSKRVNNNSLVLGLEKWTPHDLRRTGATMMQELGISLDVIDRCQNHVLAGSKIRRHYLHHEYTSEKKDAWHKLGQRLSLILSTESENVLIGNFNKAA